MVRKADIVIGGLNNMGGSLPDTLDRTTVLKSHEVDQVSFLSRMLQKLYMLQVRTYIFYLLYSSTILKYINIYLSSIFFLGNAQTISLHFELVQCRTVFENRNSLS